MKKTNYIKVIHLLHSDGRGGIEIGAKLGSKVLKKIQIIMLNTYLILKTILF